MADWYVGQKVQCIRWDWDCGPFDDVVKMPVVWRVYTIRHVEDYGLGPCLRFDEIVNPPISHGTFEEPNFHCAFFRPLVGEEAEIESREAIDA